MHPSRARTPLLDIRLLRPREAPRPGVAAAAAAEDASAADGIMEEELDQGRPAAASRVPRVASACTMVESVSSGAGPPPPPKKARSVRAVGEDIPDDRFEDHCDDSFSHPDELLGGSVLDQLMRDECEARLASVSAQCRAAGLTGEGAAATSCENEDADEDDEMQLVGMDEGF